MDQKMTGALISTKSNRPWRTPEAARWCGMSERRLLEFAREGVIPARKVGGVWYFSPQKLAEFFGVSL